MQLSVLPPAKFLAPLCHQIWPSDATLPKIDHIPILFLSGLKDEIIPSVTPERAKGPVAILWSLLT